MMKRFAIASSVITQQAAIVDIDIDDTGAKLRLSCKARRYTGQPAAAVPAVELCAPSASPISHGPAYIPAPPA